MTVPDWVDTVKFDDQGLVPAVVVDDADGAVLMVAYMNREALLETLARRRGVFWSRSRKKMWRKGEESGHVQEVASIALDCDRDCVLLRVTQVGGAACHTGRRSCFFHHVTPDHRLEARGDLLFDPQKVYGA